MIGMIPTDELIFSEGVETTNQTLIQGEFKESLIFSRKIGLSAIPFPVFLWPSGSFYSDLIQMAIDEAWG